MNKWIIGVCSLFLLVSCSKDDDSSQSSNNPTNGGAEIINFSSNVRASVIVEIEGPVTRAPLTNFENNAQIGLFGIPTIGGGTQGGRNLYDCKRKEDFQQNLFNALYVYVEGYDKLQTENVATYPGGNDPALQLYGYYPYSSDAKYMEINGTAQWAVPWQLNVEDMAQTKDYMYVEPKLAAYNKVGLEPVVLLFQHAMGRLDFRFYSTNKQIATAGYSIENVTVQCYTDKSGWMAVTDGELSVSPQPEKLLCKYPLDNVGITYLTPGESAAKFMFPPQALIQKITCDVIDAGANRSTYVIYDDTKSGYDISLKAGKTTDMRVNFLPKNASYASDIDAWTRTTVDVNVKLQ
ncbi:fimbrillin family protein [Bacteroides congonensis]